MTVLERLRGEREHEVTLPSGLKATLRLPWVQDCIAAVGDIPLPVLQHLETKANEGEKPAPNEAEAVRRFNEAMVRTSVVALEGEPVTLPADEPLAAFLDEDDAIEIVRYASRAKPVAPGEA